MGWKLRERFIPHEEAYQAKFGEIAANGAVPLDKFLECARDAGLNELVAQTAFSEVDTSDGAGLNYEQFKYVLSKLGWKQKKAELAPAADAELQRVFKEFQTAPNGMKQEAFVRAAQSLGVSEVMAEAGFRAVDQAGVGVVDFQGFREALIKLGWRGRV